MNTICVCREKLSVPGCVHALPFQAFLESEKAAYLIRPHIFADLYHRLSTRPFLSRIEKVCCQHTLNPFPSGIPIMFGHTDLDTLTLLCIAALDSLSAAACLGIHP